MEFKIRYLYPNKNIVKCITFTTDKFTLTDNYLHLHNANNILKNFFEYIPWTLIENNSIFIDLTDNNIVLLSKEL